MDGKSNLTHLITLFLLILFATCKGQAARQASIQNKETRIGGPFENSGFIYKGMPKNINATDTSPGWKQTGQKLLLTGTVYQPDGTTPAADVIIYYYHTSTEGRYLHKPEEERSMPPNSQGQTHGYIRGWVKTGADGKYAIYTVRPGTYPSRDDQAHVHVTIKEPNDINEYYIDEFVFDDDVLLTAVKRKKLDNRGGSGVMRLVYKDSLAIGERNIMLGLNIPVYPNKDSTKIESGRSVGEDVFSFTPFHAWGPDKGTKTCPVCKYGRYHGILYFTGNNPDWKSIKKWLLFLEAESTKREKYLKVYFIYGDENNYDRTEREKSLEQLGEELGLQKVALTFVPSFKDKDSDIYQNKINQNVTNTFLIYKRRSIIGKFINLQPGKDNYGLISALLDKSINEYFYLE